MKNIDIISACSDIGVHVNGARLGPENLIKKIDENSIHQIKTIKSNLNI